MRQENKEYGQLLNGLETATIALHEVAELESPLSNVLPLIAEAMLLNVQGLRDS